MKERLDWIDIARGIGILLVVLGHSVTTPIRNSSNIAMNIYNSVYYIQVPLLFYVSGLAFNLGFEKYQAQPLKVFLKKRVHRLLYPYVSYSFLVFLIFSAAHLVPKISTILDKMSYGRISLLEWIKSIFTGTQLYCQHLWYLYTLFILSVLAFLLVKIFGRNYRYILFAITVFIWIFFKTPSDYDVIWKTSIRGLWFGLGCLVGSKRYSKKDRAIIAICGVAAFAFKWLVLESMQQYSLALALKLVVIAGYLYVLIVISQMLEDFGDRVFRWFGNNSLCIYIFHQPFWGSGTGAVLFALLHLPIILCVTISIVVSILIPLLIEYILKKYKLKVLSLFLLGKE